MELRSRALRTERSQRSHVPEGKGRTELPWDSKRTKWARRGTLEFCMERSGPEKGIGKYLGIMEGKLLR